MSETTSPVSAAFDLQRNAIKQTHKAIKRSIETQQDFGETFADAGPIKQANERSYEAVRTAVEIYFNTFPSTMVGHHDRLNDFRTTIDEHLESLQANHVKAIETFEANAQEGSTPAVEFLDAFAASLDAQIEAVLAAHADVEGQTINAFDGFEDDLKAVLSEVETQFKQFEEQAIDRQQPIEDVQEDILETDKQAEALHKSLDTINGIGSTYADRLHDLGIESINALAEANAETVAKAAEVSQNQAEKWIKSAQIQK